MEKIDNYNFSSKLLHRFALKYNFIKSLVFDLDSLLTKSKKRLPDDYSPVYITGLARSGTTILLESLYRSGYFVSLTYHNMPFVTAPFFWKKYISGFWKNSPAKERAHGDKIKISYDSPEAFEEVFWKFILEKNYVKSDHLKPHKIDDEKIKLYRRYINNIVFSSGNRDLRYLAKNNNNLLRIGSLKKAFPKAVIIIPFRDPLEQANSLLKQHKRFLEIHKEDKFALEYMNWLGHFEFGENLKLFQFSDLDRFKKLKALDINYWIKYWQIVYDYLLKKHKDEVLFFCYERFCEEPLKSFSALRKVVFSNNENFDLSSVKIKASPKYPKLNLDNNVYGEAMKVYNKIQEISLN